MRNSLVAGALLAPGGPVAARVRRVLSERGVAVVDAGDPVEGAVRLALRRLDRI